jgi:hypothetical protein
VGAARRADARGDWSGPRDRADPAPVSATKTTDMAAADTTADMTATHMATTTVTAAAVTATMTSTPAVTTTVATTVAAAMASAAMGCLGAARAENHQGDRQERSEGLDGTSHDPLRFQAATRERGKHHGIDCQHRGKVRT